MDGISMTDTELLKYAVENGIINTALLQEKIEMQKREELLKKHSYNIWQGKDGKWRTYLPDEEKGRKLIKRTRKESVEDEIVSFWRRKEENPKIKEVFEENNNRKLSLGKICEATYLRDKQYFNRHYKEFGERRIKSVSEDEWEDFLEEQISEKQLKAKAFSGLKGITRSMLKRAKKRKLIDFNISDLFDNLDVSDKDFYKEIKEDFQEVFDENETDIMIKYLIGHLDISNVAILLMFLTGARIGEVVTLKHSDFNENTFNVRRTETRFLGKENKYVVEVKEYPKTKAGIRTVIIPKDYEWLCDKIKLINPFSEYIFMKNGERMSAQAIRMRLKRLCVKLDIYNKSPHKIRKTYGTILLDSNIDERLIIGQMGHTSIGTTEEHYHRNRRTIEKKSAILSDIPDLRAR